VPLLVKGTQSSSDFSIHSNDVLKQQQLQVAEKCKNIITLQTERPQKL
jgi:hypothetical protein